MSTPRREIQRAYLERIQANQGLRVSTVRIPNTLAAREQLKDFAAALRSGQSPALADFNSPDGLHQRQPIGDCQDATEVYPERPDHRRPMDNDRTHPTGDCRGGDPMNISAEAQNWLDRFFALSPESQNRVRRHIIRDTIGGLEEMMPDASKDEIQRFSDAMLAAYHET